MDEDLDDCDLSKHDSDDDFIPGSGSDIMQGSQMSLPDLSLSDNSLRLVGLILLGDASTGCD